MYNIINILIGAVLCWLAWKCLIKLNVVARDTESKEELTDAIEKFAALVGEKKAKVVAFKAKVKDAEE